MATLQKDINYSIADENAFRGWVKDISSGLQLLGLTNVSSTINTLSYAYVSSYAAPISTSYNNTTGQQTSAQTFVAYNAFDGSVSDSPSGTNPKTLATRWRSLVSPSVSVPQFIVYDAIVQKTVSSYNLLFGGNDADVKSWTFDSSSDGTTWTTRDTQVNISGTGVKSFALANPATDRYFRLNITNNNGNTSYCELIDFDIRDNTNTRLSLPVSILPTGINSNTYSEIWKFNDPFQSLSPIFFQIYFGQGANSLPMFTINVGSDQTFNRYRQFQYQINPGVRTTYFSGNGGKLILAVSGDATSIICLERTKDQIGATTTEGLAMMCGARYNQGYYGWTQSSFCCVYDNQVPRGLTETCNFLPCIMSPGRQNSVDGNTVHLFPVFPFNIKMLSPMDSLFFYFDQDITAGTVFNQKVYGSNRTYKSLGSLYLTLANGSGSTAIIWE